MITFLKTEAIPHGTPENAVIGSNGLKNSIKTGWIG